MATYKCNDPVYTVLRNGRVISMPTTPSNAIDIIVADAANVVCPPECCITAVTWDGVEFFATINTATAIGMWIRAYDDDGNEYTEWQHITSGSTVIDMSAFGEPSSGDEYCFEFSYNQVDIVTDTCCFEVQTATFEEADTYDITDMADLCAGGVFAIVAQTPASGITLSAAGELVIPALADSATLTATYGCNGCIVNFLIITASNVSVPCCIEALDYDADTFEVTVTNTDAVGWYVRVNLNDSDQTAWALSDGDDTIDLSGLTNAFEDGDLYCVEYTEDPEADPIVIVPGSCCFTVRADTYLEDATYDVSGLVDPCEGGTFALLYQDPAMGVTLDAAGEMVVPDLAEDGTVYGTFTCDGCVTDFLVLSVIEPPVGLRMVFNDIVNAPVVDPSDVAEWNTFFDLPTNGLVFTSVAVAGNQVTLYGGGAMTIKAQAFELNSSLLEIYDDANIVDTILNSAFALSAITDATFDNAVTIGAPATPGAFLGAASLVNLSLASATTFINDFASGSLSGCTSLVNLTLPSALIFPTHLLFNSNALQTFSAPLATDLGTSGMASCTAATLIDIPLCVNLGANPADATVFNGITGQTVTLNIAAVNATNNGGGVHASVAYLIANNTATVNYI